MFNIKKGHGFEVDYWAIGVILYTMLYGHYPFESKNDDVDEIYELIKNHEPEYCDQMISPAANVFIK